MSQVHPLKKVVTAQKQGQPTGIYSCCSANPYVLKAALKKGKEHNTPVLIEATANQVDQYGGYTGMKPSDFIDFVNSFVKEIGIEPNLVILGGDHLGPLTFANLNEDEAMKEASELVRQYVLAGFTKIHLDTSMRIASDDKNLRLSDETIARRGAELCLIAEEAFSELKSKDDDLIEPVYVIGSEVPIPGGAQEEEEGVLVTSPQACNETIAAFESAFKNLGLHEAWKRVIGVVVQPGVEFGNAQVQQYNRKVAKELVIEISKYDGMVFEGHSTDYQTKHALKEMVEDGIAILKVGPALTFGLREGLIALEMIEKEMFGLGNVHLSNFRNILDATMLDNPKNWEKHYHGSATYLNFARIFSFSDRARYYMTEPAIEESITRLLGNLSKIDIPLTLISQYMPVQYVAVMEKRIQNDPEELLIDRISNYIDDYLFATGVI